MKTIIKNKTNDLTTTISIYQNLTRDGGLKDYHLLCNPYALHFDTYDEMVNHVKDNNLPPILVDEEVL